MGGSQSGYGHLSRMIPLYDEFERRGAKVSFQIKGDQAVHGILEGREAELTDWLEEPSVEVASHDIIIIDVLTAPVEFIQRMTDATPYVYFISDAAETPEYPFKVINWRVFAENINASNGLYGAQYAPLRKELLNTKGGSRKRELLQVVLSMGAGDVLNLIPTTLDLFANHYKDHFKFKVVIRSFHKEYEQIVKTYGEQVEILSDLNAQDLFDQLTECDFAIASGGHSIYEFAYLGIPVIHVLVADNQEPAKCWDNTRFTHPIGIYNSSDYAKKVEEGIEFFLNDNNRRKASQRGKELIDGKGAFRIVNELTRLSA